MHWAATSSAIVLGNPSWSGVVLSALVFSLVLLVILSWNSVLPPFWKWLFFSLKATSLAILALCLLDPRSTSQRARPGENIVVMLADQSASQQVRQSPNSQESRGDVIRNFLTEPDASWQVRMAQDFDVRRYCFGASLDRVESFQDLTFESPATNLKEALATLTSRFSGKPLAAVLLFTDGNPTSGNELTGYDHRVPLYCAIPDDNRQLADLAIRQVSVSQSNFEDAPVTLRAEISSTLLTPEEVIVTLRPPGAEAESPHIEFRQVTTRDGQATAEFQIKPQHPGVQFYELSVAFTHSPGSRENARLNQEATLLNNHRLVAVNRDSRVHRILYLAGRPNWEHKFLNRALAEDPRLQLISLIRIATKEARFDFRGRVGESSNPLFRGFKGEADEETEAYDQPVLIRLNTRDERELQGGFPKTRAELFQYDAVILDDVEASFLTHDQLSLLDRFVSERGGGLLMLGGRDTYRHGHWQGTPVADALPVYLDAADAVPEGPLKWNLTREGWLEPSFRLRDNEVEERQRLKETAALTQLNATRSLKPGARLMAEVQSADGKTYPALVVQQYGRGRSAAVLGGDLWKWSMRSTPEAPDDAGKSWRQMIRWLVGDVPRRLELTTEAVTRGIYPATLLKIRVRDAEFQPQDSARLDILVEQPDGKQVPLSAEPSLNEAGLFEVEVVSRLAGPYLARVSLPGDEGLPPMKQESGWTSDPLREEFRQVGLNVPLLETLARKTDGEVVRFSELDDLSTRLLRQDLPVMQTETTPLWHQPWLLMLVMMLLATEWGLRRWRGFA
ncbi:glutamine amidotransferase [Planctomicrobium sp. SH664]|uniref:glutamine amidotransferase n=1 Tax=Planctomicrobium sp. SH664 TaxID=3448125 RepID=UPI003F5B6C86